MGSWKGFDDVEFVTLEWVDRYNKEKLFGTIGYVPPTELDAKYWESESMQEAKDSKDRVSEEPGAVHSIIFCFL